MADAVAGRAGRCRTRADRWRASARGRTCWPAPKHAGAEASDTTSRPSYSNGIGGIDTRTSSARRLDQAVQDRRTPTPATEPGHDPFSPGHSGARPRPSRSSLERRRCPPQAGTGPLEGAVHGIDRGVEHLGDVPGGEAEDVPQHEHGDLAWRQDLERRDEREGDRLTLLVAGFGAHGMTEGAVEEGIRIRLQPQHLAVRVGSGP